jgi:hypothetical protein
MRSVLAIIASTLLAAPLFAADQTLLDAEDVWKLYSQFEYKSTDGGDSRASFGGVGVGGIMNDTIDVGAMGYALVHDFEVDDDAGVNVRAIGDYWTAGATAGYTFMPSILVHVRLGIYAGYGELHTHPDIGEEESGSFAVIEPNATVFNNVSETVELGLGVGWWSVEGSDYEQFDDGDLSSVSWSASLRVSEF